MTVQKKVALVEYFSQPILQLMYTQMNANEATKGITIATELRHRTGVQGKRDFKATDEKSILKNDI